MAIHEIPVHPLIMIYGYGIQCFSWAENTNGSFVRITLLEQLGVKPRNNTFQALGYMDKLSITEVELGA
jgi:hypothetical protein